MKVLFVSHVSSKYGASRSLLLLIDGLRADSIDCYVLLPRNGALAEELKKMDIPHSVFPFKNWAGSSLKLWKRIGRTAINTLAAVVVAVKARREEADLIYTNSSVAPVGAFAACLARIPHVWHIREFGREDYGLNFDVGDERSYRLINRLSNRVVVISQALATKLREYIDEDKLTIVYNPAQEPSPDELNDLPARPSELPTFAIVGLLHPAKGQMEALRALEVLVEQGHSANLIIIGDGDAEYKRALHEYVASTCLSDYVQFTGYVEQPSNLMKQADAVLVCSRCEAFGRVTVEAMLAGRPVIGADSGATPELLTDHFNGLCYEAGDWQSLAEKMVYVIDHPKEARAMGENGLQWAREEFAPVTHTERILSVLREVIGERNHN